MVRLRKMRVLAAISLAVFLTGPALGQEAADIDFSGETIELIVPFGPGGGSSIHAQLVAPILARELPGQPTIVIRNIEGAGSIRGVNQFQQEAKPDGLMIASLGTGTFFSYLLEDPAVAYDLPGYLPFMSSSSGLVAYARTDLGLTEDPVANIETLRASLPVYAGEAPTAADMTTLVALHLLDIKMSALFGLSNAEARAAFERGEVGVRFDNTSSWESGVRPLVDDGTATPLFTFGLVNAEGDIVRDPIVPDAPTFNELYEAVNGKSLEGTPAQVWDMLLAIRALTTKTFVLPEGTPDAIVQVYSEAMARALESPELKRPEAIAILGEYPQLTGAESMRVFTNAAEITDEQRQWLKDWLRDTYDVK